MRDFAGLFPAFIVAVAVLVGYFTTTTYLVFIPASPQSRPKFGIRRFGKRRYRRATDHATSTSMEYVRECSTMVLDMNTSSHLP